METQPLNFSSPPQNDVIQGVTLDALICTHNEEGCECFTCYPHQLVFGSIKRNSGYGYGTSREHPRGQCCFENLSNTQQVEVLLLGVCRDAVTNGMASQMHPCSSGTTSMSVSGVLTIFCQDGCTLERGETVYANVTNFSNTIRFGNRFKVCELTKNPTPHKIGYVLDASRANQNELIVDLCIENTMNYKDIAPIDLDKMYMLNRIFSAPAPQQPIYVSACPYFFKDGMLEHVITCKNNVKNAADNKEIYECIKVGQEVDTANLSILGVISTNKPHDFKFFKDQSPPQTLVDQGITVQTSGSITLYINPKDFENTVPGEMLDLVDTKPLKCFIGERECEIPRVYPNKNGKKLRMLQRTGDNEILALII